MEKNEALDNIRNSFKFDQIFNMSDVVEAVLTNNVEGLEEMRLFLASQKNKKADIEKLIIESSVVQDENMGILTACLDDELGSDMCVEIYSGNRNKNSISIDEIAPMGSRLRITIERI